MNIVINILLQPRDFIFFVWKKIGTLWPLVTAGLAGQRSLELILIGKLIGWLALVVIIVAVILWVVRFVLEDALTGARSFSEFGSALTSVVWRLIVILFLYVCLSILLYALAGLSDLIWSGVSYRHP
jgi:hypothetical protein